MKSNEATIPEGSVCDVGLDKNFAYLKQVSTKYEIGEEVGHGHFGYTCSAQGKRWKLKGQEVAVKVSAGFSVDGRLRFFSIFCCFQNFLLVLLADSQIHYETTGPEIWEDTLGQVDIFVMGIGSGETLSGVGRYIDLNQQKATY